jgi:transposase
MLANKGTHLHGGKKPHRYPVEIRTQAVEMYHGCKGEFSSKKKAAEHIANLIGVGSYDSVLSWVQQSEIDKGDRKGITSDELAEIRKLRRENAELRRANGILKAASAFFAAELDRPLNK